MGRQGDIQFPPGELPQLIRVTDILAVNLTGVEEGGVLVELFPGAQSLLPR
jgi:hypothetical protein